MQEFKDRLAFLMKERGFSQRELSSRTHLTESAISHYMKGDREPKGAILLNIANVLGTSTDYLKGLTDDVKPTDAEDDIEEALRLVSRHAVNMSLETKNRFAEILFGGKKEEWKKF